MAVISFRRIVIARMIAIGIVFLLVAAGIYGLGLDPGMVGRLVVTSTFGTRFGLENLALYMTPLLLTGAAVWLALRAGLWNIGAEGQFLAGASAAAAIGLSGGANPALAGSPAAFMSSSLTLVLAMTASFLAGALWSALPAAGRAWLGVSEIITTLLMNFIALYMVYALVTGPWADKVTGAQMSSARIEVVLPAFAGAVHCGWPIALLAVAMLALLFRRSRFSYCLALCGSNPEAARYAGIDVGRHVFVTLLLSGGIAGIGGMIEVFGTVHRLQGGLANGYGYLGIVVALLARKSALALVPAALLMAIILNAGIVLQTVQVSASAVLAMTGLLVFAIAVADDYAAWSRSGRAS
ncbi:ABC transporter permease [Swaminathania salitolerans]|uniref:ABC transporter permease n=1 Tax=Swaminathania salitolerans TaxID=182838 RepID=A0A511BNS9_9PROT|nr:ABC transporter permease [Swaminathania salitolerans]GBQ13826.1 inner-membrane translocator [Swaminathania salitolerans LMG 21291]GEL01722.1 ABC transporter permease [Swaminathania salitolerans]